jgi:vancomycin permeability regulator SanA
MLGFSEHLVMTATRFWKYSFRTVLFITTIVLLAASALIWDGLHDEIGTADLGVVLGNTVNVDGSPSPRLAARLDRTLELYRQGAFPLVLVSGALGKEGHDEASVMRDYLTAHGIPSAHVFVDSQGHTTLATAKNTKALMELHGLQSVLVISQYFHVSRVKLAMRRFGISTVYSAHARHFEARDLYSIVRELLGYVSYTFTRYETSPEKA